MIKNWTPGGLVATIFATLSLGPFTIAIWERMAWGLNCAPTGVDPAFTPAQCAEVEAQVTFMSVLGLILIAPLALWLLVRILRRRRR